MTYKTTTRTITLIFTALATLTVAATGHADETKLVITIETPAPATGLPVVPDTPPFSGDRAAVDVAILLDTSNSMDGLIGQAKTQLWTIVQQFAEAKKAGKTPLLRVSVMEYGNSGLPASEGYLRQVVPLTDNLDDVSEGLFGLTTNGGDEYCGQVINEALQRLDWNKQSNNYKVIFIAGNEPFTQGAVKYQDACRRAIEAGVVVNTIHCGDYEAGIQGQWQAGADLAEGEYFNINQDKVVRHIPCPQDKILIELNTRLNQTYLWFGSDKTRKRNFENQVVQDNNSGAEMGLRCAVKASAAYRNVGRDLVDTLEADSDILAKVKKEELPQEMQAMTLEQRKKHLATTSARRTEIKKKIAEISKSREAHLAKARQQLATSDGDSTLGDVIVDTIRKQLKSRDFEIKE